MKKTLLVSLISLLFISQSSAAQNPFAFKIFRPDFIRVNSEFEISLLASDQLLQYDELSLSVYSDANLKLVKSRIKNPDMDEKLDFSTGNDYEESGNYRITVPGRFLRLSGKIFQLNLTFTASDITQSEISFALETTKVSSGYDTDKEVSNEVWEYDLPSVKLNFYDPRNAVGKSAVIENNSKMNLDFSEEDYAPNLLVSFWARTNKTNNSFFDILDKNSQENIFSISKTQFGIVKVPEDLTGYDFNEFYISENSYNFYSVLLSTIDQTAKLYINGRIIYSTPYLTNYALNQLSIEFHSDSSSVLEIDELKLINLGDNIHELFRNMHYKTYTLDSSLVIYSQNFDVDNPENLNSQSVQVKLNFDKIRLADSEVPVFSRTPVLKVGTYETFYELTWTNPDDLNVSSYEIEKSLDGKEYEPVSNIPSLNDPAHDYYYVDSRNELDEVVYYRIRQMNKDGSANYSPGVKLGSAQIDYFKVEQNYPNPFNPVTTVSVEIFFEAEFEITVYDLVGTKIKIIHKGPLTKGVHVFPFDGSNLTSGVYIFEVASPYSNQAIKMILAK